ncbi:MAG: NADH-quinone oxidoreductase subunit M [Candidatus Omnitrophota bacterium]|jgi:NADH-quinone oxidoreductase subunit M
MVYALSAVPFLAALAILLTPSDRTALLRRIALAGTGFSFVLTLVLFAAFDRSRAGFQFVSSVPWIPSLGISYTVGLDGINLTLCLLHALVSFAGAFMAVRTTDRLKTYLFFYMVLSGAIYGVFTALDLFFLYLFYETTLIPLYPMIGIWGSKNKEYGAMKLTLFITTGAVLSLFGLLMLVHSAGLNSFDLAALTRALQAAPLSDSLQRWLAPVIVLGFGVIASLWPLHSWSPIGYAAAPTSVSMLHAGVLKKMGPYFILRVAVALLPLGTAHWSSWLAILATTGILYAGYAAIRQRDLKFMVGFSSVSHMGYVLLGIAAMTQTSLTGTVLLMFAHGIMAAATFALIGWIYEQTHARGVLDFGGLAKQIPFVGVSFVLVSLASLGLPGFVNFAAELTIFVGSWTRFPWAVALAVFGILITAIYLLRAVQSVCYGPVNPRWKDLKDAQTLTEKWPFLLLIGALIVFGFYPRALTALVGPAVAALTGGQP